MRFLILLAAASLASTALAEPVSGRYGRLLVVIQDGKLSGVVSDQVRGGGTDGAPQFLCVALLDGRVSGEGAEVEAWLPDDPERIGGTLHLTARDAVLRLDENPPGCMMSANMKGEGQRWPFDDAGLDWIGVGLITTERAVLHPEPVEDAARRRPYLIEWDAVAVLEQRDGWAHVEFVDADTPARGWLRLSELALALPGGE